MQNPNSSATTHIRLTEYAHGGGCGCKLAPGVLSSLLKDTAKGLMPEALLVGIETSDDAAVYQLNDEQALIATTDFFMPIVDDPFDFGRIAATNAISDVYAMGGQPIFALSILAMPINKLPADTIRKILAGGESICKEAGIPIAGGHSIDSVEPIYGLVVLGLAHPKHIKRNCSAKAGDVLILSKPIGVGVYSAALKKGRLTEEHYAHFIANTTRLNKPGAALAKLDGVHALTDVTGFGLLGHLLEVMKGSNTQAQLDASKVPLLPGVEQLEKDGFVTGASKRNWDSYGQHIQLNPRIDEHKRHLLTDPQTSGGLLISCSRDVADQVLQTLHNEGFNDATVIGTVTKKVSDHYIVV
jgi:selenide,water dikinase